MLMFCVLPPAAYNAIIKPLDIASILQYTNAVSFCKLRSLSGSSRQEDSMISAKTHQKPYKGLPMEGFIASWYARNTRNDGRRFTSVAKAVASQVAPGGAILEVAPGPGYLAIQIAKLGDFKVSGLDISKSFVRIARENAQQAGVSIDFREGNAAQMPFPDETFDFVVCTAAFKNFTAPVGALNEIHRVLKPGGKASIFDLRKDASREAIDEEVRGMQMSRLNTFFT